MAVGGLVTLGGAVYLDLGNGTLLPAVGLVGNDGIPAGTGPEARGFPVTVVASSGPEADALGRMRTSSPHALFDTQNTYDASPLFWDTVLAGGGTTTYLQNQSGNQLNVTGASGDSVKYQTHNYLRYQPGKSQLLLATGVLGAPVTNCVKRVGYFGDNNGLFFEQAGTGPGVVRRSFVTGSPVDVRIPQAQWNLDTLDGSNNQGNPSGVKLDLTKMQIFVIDFQWLSIGQVRWGFEINGRLVYCHAAYHANVLSTPYMSTANLPIRYEITNTGATGGNNNVLAVCSVVMAEGGQEQFGIPFTAEQATAVAVGGASVPILSIRLNTSFQGLTTRGLVRPTQIDALVSGGQVFVEAWLNPTLTGANFANLDATNSMVQIDTAATAMSGGQRVAVASAAAGQGQTTVPVTAAVNLGKRLLSLNAPGTTSDILTLAATKVASTPTVAAALSWVEHR